jgi:hypothetical protein
MILRLFASRFFRPIALYDGSSNVPNVAVLIGIQRENPTGLFDHKEIITDMAAFLQLRHFSDCLHRVKPAISFRGCVEGWRHNKVAILSFKQFASC